MSAHEAEIARLEGENQRLRELLRRVLDAEGVLRITEALEAAAEALTNPGEEANPETCSECGGDGQVVCGTSDDACLEGGCLGTCPACNGSGNP